jgi:UDP-N-acetylmuramate--alanine ligase
VACELDIGIDIIQSALKSFAGVERRLDYHGKLTINNHQVNIGDDAEHGL